MSNFLHKIVIYLVKTIPVITAFLFLLNIILSYFCINLEIFSHISGVSVFSLLFMYAASIAYQFCLYHRVCIHYITLIWLINLYDYYIGIPLSSKHLLYLYLIITGIFLFIILYEHCRKRNIKVIKKCSRQF